MKLKPTLVCLVLLTLLSFGLVSCQASDNKGKKQDGGMYEAIYSGIPWFDNNLNPVSAHGACIVKDEDRFYLFGEFKSDTSNAFVGFSCYSSTDLMNWKFENVVLPLQESGLVGPNRVGERVKVLKCPKTGEYIMLMHTDNLQYKDPVIGYATSNKIDGNYTFQGPLLFNGEPIRRWDMGTFQDTDGSGYLIIHHGSLYKLSDDYKSIVEQTAKGAADGESPAIFKKDGVYFWLGSGLTGWERNDNFYYTATSLSGPWTSRGIFAPKDKLTWNSQTTFVLTVPGTKDTTYMFMGDRWSHPRQRSAATYVWQPMEVEGTSISIPDYKEGWKVDVETGEAIQVSMDEDFIDNTDEKIHYTGNWTDSDEEAETISSADAKGASFEFQFEGTQVGFYSLATPDGGYAEVTITNDKGDVVTSSIVEMYCRYPVKSLMYLSPELKNGRYKLKVTVLEEKWGWTEKTGKVWGAEGYRVNLDKIFVKD